MTPSNNLYAVTKFYEGFSASVYIDAAGFKTIGIGHKVRDDETFSSITVAEAEEMLRDDMADAVYAVNAMVTVPLTQGQFDCLCDFTYNLGGGKLKESTLLKRLNAKDYDSVPSEVYRWIYADGKPMAGLIKRRKAEISLWNDEVPEL
jgi:lysozyme